MEQSTYATLSRLTQHCLEDKSEKSIIDCLDFMANVLDFKNAIMTVSLIQDNESSFIRKLNHSYPEAWINTYLSHTYEKVDPVIEKSVNCSTPFSWKECYQETTLSNSQIVFIDAANDYKMDNGVTFAVHSKKDDSQIVTLCSLVGVPENQYDNASKLLYFTLPIFNSILQIIEISTPINLTRKEIEVLQWAKEGKTAWETSLIMTLSESAIKYHFKNIFRKLSVSNKTQAIAYALINKII